MTIPTDHHQILTPQIVLIARIAWMPVGIGNAEMMHAQVLAQLPALLAATI